MPTTLQIDPASPLKNSNASIGPSDSAIRRIPLDILTLDLSRISTRLLNKYDWPELTVRRVEVEYKMFLTIVREKLGTNAQLVPSRPVDDYWHLHILFTRDYSMQCLKLFGEYLHHEPTDGTEEHRNELEENGVCNYLATGDLFKQRFGYRPLEYRPDEYSKKKPKGDKRCCWCSGAPTK